MKKHKHYGRWPAACLSAILMVVLALPLLTPLIAEAAAPDTPVNVSPADGATGISLTCTLTSSAFYDGDGDTHVASRWQIAADDQFNDIAYDSGVNTSSLVELSVPSGNLDYDTTYYWHVRHLDNAGYWSGWSTETSFTTLGAEPPGTPINVSPADGAVDVTLTPTLESSPFTDPDEGDAHVASYWQIRTDSGTYDSPIFDSGVTTSSKTSIAISPGDLEYGTTYYWHVMYQDSYGKWSEWSTETSFTTIADTTPPVISMVSSSGITSTAATIAWTTDEPSTSLVEYGLTASYGSASEDAALVTGHSVILSGLTPGTTYHYRVKSRDVWDNEGASGDNTFTTTASGAPGTPVNLSPADGAVDITLTLTLESSAFTDPDTGDTHTASQWQIRNSSGSYGSPVFDSGVSISSKTSIAIPSGELSYETEYCWHVRYRDSYDNWSGWSTETSFTTISNSAPDKPANISPASTATDISLTPTLIGSAFSDPNAGDNHTASQWQIRKASGSYGSPVFDSGVSISSKTSIAIPSGELSYGTKYYWHVSYRDSYDNWSGWSAETSFTTISSSAPDKPANISPASTATDISLTPTLIGSAFSDPDAGDVHIASQWQMRNSSGSYGSPVYDSGTDTSNKTSITVPPGKLIYETEYCWHVRYRDSNGNWSAYSSETCFTATVLHPPGQPAAISPPDEATGISLSPTLEASAFSDPDAGDTHTASQWLITAISGDYSSPVYDSDTDTSNKTSIAVPPGKLSYGTKYYWQVRYRDSHNQWSMWSAEVSFTTRVLTADFSADITEAEPLEVVTFTDLSSGDIISWVWDFGDGVTAEWTTESMPDTGTIGHNYSAAGSYTVLLTVTGVVGTDTRMATDYITISAAAASGAVAGEGLPWPAIGVAIAVAVAGAGLLLYRSSR
ncbi:fibronectin type III domain-containing protein [Chloroflexota bacterium]